jgi:hypothetical protein
MAPFLYSNDPDNDNSPIVMLDHGNCRYTKKAMNAENIGARVALIVAKDDNLENDDDNYDDGLGSSIKIPTVIIPNSVGEKIKNFLKTNPDKQIYVAMSIDFKMVKYI